MADDSSGVPRQPFARLTLEDLEALSGKAQGLIEAARGRIGVMVCGNVRPENVQQIAQATGARAFHASLRAPVPSPVTYRNPTLNLGEAGSDEYTRNVVIAQDVRKLRQAMEGILSSSSKTAG